MASKKELPHPWSSYSNVQSVGFDQTLTCSMFFSNKQGNRTYRRHAIHGDWAMGRGRHRPLNEQGIGPKNALGGLGQGLYFSLGREIKENHLSGTTLIRSKSAL